MTGEPTAPIALTWHQAADLRTALHNAATFENDGAFLARLDILDAALGALMLTLPNPLDLLTAD